MLITPSYRELNKLLHDVVPEYGTSGDHDRYMQNIWRMIDHHGTTDILDYGCGKRYLEKKLGFPIANYDPAIEGFDASPEPHDLVVCTDVLEHIEPECLDDVLKDIRRCTRVAALLVVATRPASKTLADGRNAHLIQEPYEWWKVCFDEAGLKVLQMHEIPEEFAVVCEPCQP